MYAILIRLVVVMRNRFALSLVATSICWPMSGVAEVQAQTATPRAGQNIITKFRLQPEAGPLFVTIDGREKEIAKEARQAWIIERGRKLAYTTSEGASGMGSGGTLNVYDAATNQHKMLTIKDDDIVTLKEARSIDGKTALLLELGNEEGCKGTVVVVNPSRGEVFSEFPAKLLSTQGDIVSLGYFTEAEWNKNCEKRPKQMKPYKRKSFSLSALLKRRAIAPGHPR